MKKHPALTLTHPLLAAQWHPTKNGTWQPSETSAGSRKKAWWICASGHEWETNVEARVRGNGCPYCAGKRAIAGISDLGTTDPAVAKEWHSTKNGSLTPSNTTRASSRKIWWQDELGHEWLTSPSNRTRLGNNCPYCSGRFVLSGATDLATQYPSLVCEWHPTKNGALLPSQVTPFTRRRVWWLGSTCGHEWQAPIAERSRGRGCPFCSRSAVLAGFSDLASQHPKIAYELSLKNGPLDPSTIASGSNVSYLWECTQGHEWRSDVYHRTTKNGRCSICYRQSSKAEDSVADYIESLGFEVQRSVRKVLPGKYSIDVFLPQMNLAIEYNGLRWHSELFAKSPEVHRRKWQAAQSVGVQMIQIWEDDWRERRALTSGLLAARISAYAKSDVVQRRRDVVAVPYLEAKAFLEQHHLQGAATGSLYLALQGEDKTTLAVLVVKRRKAGEYRIIRYAADMSAGSAFEELLSHLEAQYEPSAVYAESDNLLDEGQTYSNHGFVSVSSIPPDYMYVSRNLRHPKSAYSIERFQNDPELLFEEGLSRDQLAVLNKLPRIWDAGKTRWTKEL